MELPACSSPDSREVMVTSLGLLAPRVYLIYWDYCWRIFQNQIPASCILCFTHDNNLINEASLCSLVQNTAEGAMTPPSSLSPIAPPQYLKQEFKNDQGIISVGNVRSELECVDSTQWIFYFRTEQGHLADSLLADAEASLPQVFCDLQMILGFKSGLDYSDENVTIHSGNTPTLNMTSVFPLFERFFKKKMSTMPYIIFALRGNKPATPENLPSFRVALH